MLPWIVHRKRRFYALMIAYFAIHVIIRTMISGSLSFDESEQAFLSQELSLGYNSQPPLYTWVQAGLFDVFGYSVASLAILKNALLLLTYLLVYGIVARATENRVVAGVCLLRSRRFDEAIAILRPIAVNLSTLTLRQEVPRYIQLNFAAALAFGGEPAGALDVIAEAKAADDAVARQIKACIDKWVSNMSFLKRLDWNINRIAPKTRPQPPGEPRGQFGWEIT